MNKKTYIVSTYVNSYEWITTKDTRSLLFLKLKYWRDGHRVWDYPLWLGKLVYNLTGKPIMKGRTVTFELYVPGTDQITYHTPYHNFL